MAIKSKQETDAEKLAMEQEIAELRNQIQALQQSQTLAGSAKEDKHSGDVHCDDSLYQALFERSENPIVVYDSDANIVLANEFAIRTLNSTREEVIGKPLGKFIPETHDLTVKRIRDVLKSGKVGHFEDRINIPGGTFWFWTAMESITLHGIKNKYVQSISYNITDTKKAHLALERAEASYKNLFSNMSQGAFYQKLNGKITNCNQACLDLFGLSRDEFLGRTSMNPEWQVVNEKGEALPGEQHPSMVALRTGKPIRNAVTAVFNPRLKDWVWLNINAIPVARKGHEKPEEVFVTMHDITELKKTQQALIESEGKLIEISNQLPGAIYQFKADAEGNFSIPFISSGAIQLFNKNYDEVRNNEIIFNTLHPADRENYLSSVNYSKEHLTPWEYEGRVIWDDGSIHWIRGKSIPRKQDDGSIIWNGVLIDITKQKESEIELAKAKSFFEQLYLQSATSTQLLDPEGWCLRINPKLSELFGVKPEDIEGRKYNILHDGEIIRTGVIDKLQRVFKHKETAEWEVNFDIGYASESTGVKVSKPVKRYFYNIGYPILDKQGKLEYVIIQHEDITKRKQAELALKESRAQLNTILQTAPVGIGMVNERKFIFANQELCQMLGYTYDELVGQSVRMLYASKQEFDRVGKIMYPMVREKGTASIETRLQEKNGNPIDVHMITSLINIQDPGEGYVSSVVNITERNRNLQSLSESEAQLKQAQRVARLGHWSYEVATQKVSWSEEIFHIFRLDPNEEEPDITNHKNYIHPDDWDLFSSSVENAISQGKGFNQEIRLKLKAKKEIWVKIQTRVKKARGKVTQLLGTIQDISKQKRIELALKRNEKDLKFKNQIVEAFIRYQDHELFAKVLKKNLKRFNCQFGFFGYINEEGDLVSPSMTYDIWDECEMKNKTILFPKESWSGMWGKSLKEKKSIIKNKKLSAPKGHVPLDNALAVCITYHDELIGQIVLANKPGGFRKEDRILLEDICNYISPLLRATLQEENYRKELIIAKEKAEESDRLKSAFLANMSHEIRTPMNGILGFSKLLTNPGLSDHKRLMYSKMVDDTSNQLLSIVNDILDISLIESGQLKLNLEVFNLNELLNELFNIFLSTVKSRMLELNLEIELEDTGTNIKTDPTRLSQVLSNLLNNAVKFTHQGSISFGYQLEAGRLKFYVKDTGIGIAKENQAKVFERFRQEDLDMNRSYGGTGLGLSISKRLVELLDGEIWLESEKGKGSCFYFTIPYIQANQVVLPETESVTSNTKGLNLLVVEDEEVNRLYIQELLAGEDFKITYCSNGQDAIEICEKNPDIDIILMDIRLPGMNGYEATRSIRKFRPNIPIIAQTAYAMPTDRDKALAAGCNDYISKPIQRVDLLNIIAQYS